MSLKHILAIGFLLTAFLSASSGWKEGWLDEETFQSVGFSTGMDRKIVSEQKRRKEILLAQAVDRALDELRISWTSPYYASRMTDHERADPTLMLRFQHRMKERCDPLIQNPTIARQQWQSDDSCIVEVRIQRRRLRQSLVANADRILAELRSGQPFSLLTASPMSSSNGTPSSSHTTGPGLPMVSNATPVPNQPPAMPPPSNPISHTNVARTTPRPGAHVAVRPFAIVGAPEALGEWLAELLRYELCRVGEQHRFTVVNQSVLKDVLKEQAFQQSGLVDEASAVRAGRILALEYLFAGSLTRVENQYLLTAFYVSVERGDTQEMKVYHLKGLGDLQPTLNEFSQGFASVR